MVVAVGGRGEGAPGRVAHRHATPCQEEYARAHTGGHSKGGHSVHEPPRKPVEIKPKPRIPSASVFFSFSEPARSHR